MPTPGRDKDTDQNKPCGSDSDKPQSVGATTGRKDGARDAQQLWSMPPATQRLMQSYMTEVAASTASVISTLTTFPLDSVKTRMQTYQYNGFVDCVRRTYQTEKLRGFFRGVTAPMASITFVRTISFSIYQRSKETYCGWVKDNFGVDVMARLSQKGSRPDFWSLSASAIAGACAGSVITVVACPFELAKLSAQVSELMANEKTGANAKQHAVAATYRNKGTIMTMRNIVRHRGFAGLYTGFNMHLMRDTLGTGIYFMAYESTKQLLTSLGGGNPNFEFWSVLFAGGSCGVISWSLIYPVDSAKNIYQRNCLMHTKGEKVEPVKIEWFKRNMYRGLTVSMVRSCAINAIFFSAYEFMKAKIQPGDA